MDSGSILILFIFIAGEILGSIGAAMSTGGSGLVIGNFAINLLMYISLIIL